jgi:hypothetical protein
MKPVDRGHVPVTRGVRYERMRLFGIFARASPFEREQAESIPSFRAVGDAQPFARFFFVSFNTTRTFGQQLGVLALGLGLAELRGLDEES